MKLVSIIVPVYNSFEYIGRCVESILNQTYQHFEVIFIDDGSTDQSGQILEKYAKKDKRIKVIHQKNMGVAKTRNKGVELAKGEYVAFIDNDDYIDATYLENFMNDIDQFDVVVGGYKRVSEEKTLFVKKMNSASFTKYENVAPWGKIIRKDFLIQKGIKFFSYPIGEDIIFNMDLYTLSDRIKVIENYGYNWFFNSKSVSNTTQKAFDKDILVLFEQMKKHDRDEETKYFIARYSVWYLLFSGRYSTSEDFVLEYQKIRKWLIDNHYLSYLSFRNIFKKESSIKNKFVISIFLVLMKVHFIFLFSKFYCKGKVQK